MNNGKKKKLKSIVGGLVRFCSDSSQIHLNFKNKLEADPIGY